MKKSFLFWMSAMLVVLSAGCSKDGEPKMPPTEPNNEEIPSVGDNNDKGRNEALSYLQDKTWGFRFDGNILDDNPVTYCFNSDGTLEVIDKSEYGPIFFASGKYEYSAVLDEKPDNDGIISGTLTINNMMYRFWIGEFPEYPDYLNLVIFFSTVDGGGWYSFICKK